MIYVPPYHPFPIQRMTDILLHTARQSAQSASQPVSHYISTEQLSELCCLCCHLLSRPHHPVLVKIQLVVRAPLPLAFLQPFTQPGAINSRQSNNKQAGRQHSDMIGSLQKDPLMLPKGWLAADHQTNNVRQQAVQPNTQPTHAPGQVCLCPVKFIINLIVLLKVPWPAWQHVYVHVRHRLPRCRTVLQGRARCGQGNTGPERSTVAAAAAAAANSPGPHEAAATAGRQLPMKPHRACGRLCTSALVRCSARWVQAPCVYTHIQTHLDGEGE